MAQKITLSIPDMLHEKLTEFRSSFNLSKMFQDAVTDAIQKKEALQKRFSDEFDMSEIVKRLRKEKRDWENKFYASGKHKGIEWARVAHFEDLLYVLHINDTYAIVGQAPYKDYFQALFQACDLGKYSNESGNTHEHKFMDGWFQGVRSFWNEIKEQI